VSTTEDKSQQVRTWITPELISGTVWVSVVVAIADEQDGIFEVFLVTLATIVVFWLTEVFAMAIAAEARHRDEPPRIGRSILNSMGRSSGFLLSGIPALIVLAIGSLDPSGGTWAYWIALWIGTVVLAVLGWIIFTGPYLRWYWRPIGALATALLGVLVVILKVLVHH
jgi:hypothetical protein